MCSNSEHGKKLLTRFGCSSGKISVIPNGVDLEKIDQFPSMDLKSKFGWPDSCIVVGFVGRLIWYKGAEVMVQALAKLNETHQAVCGVIVGDGPDQTQLENLAKQLGIGDKIVFTGRVHPPEPWVKGFDIATSTTLTNSESCSNSILEYMACGKPVVASTVSGNPELVVEQETGLLVPPGDADALADAIGQMLSDPQLMLYMGQMGRKRIEEHFQIDSITQRFVSLWQQVARDSSL